METLKLQWQKVAEDNPHACWDKPIMDFFLNQARLAGLEFNEASGLYILRGDMSSSKKHDKTLRLNNYLLKTILRLQQGSIDGEEQKEMIWITDGETLEKAGAKQDGFTLEMEMEI